MRKALLLLLFLLGGVAFALVVGSNAASASVLPPLVEQDQTGTNTNSTTQDSGAEATTHQANVNLPISVLSWGSNNGDVDQSNEADTKAVAVDENDTDQSVDQDQSADVAGSRGTSHGDKRDGAGVTQDQSGSNENSTEQGAESSASTSQVNVNAPVSVLSWGSNNGDVDQSNDADTTAIAGNTNDTDQSVDQDQQAASGGSKGSGGSIDQSQDAYNGNETTQNAGADASTKQANVNVPISVLSWGSNNGDVDQSNEADTKAYAENVNDTDQSIDQDQNAKVADSPKGHHPSKDGYGHKGEGNHGGSGSIDQDQAASNDNATDQTADATATTEQKNVNLPISFLSWGGSSCGCSKGGSDVDQSNDADTIAFAGNANDTDQSVDQDQQAASGGSKGSGGSIDQSQDAYNGNETTQNAGADASTKQANVNAPISILSWGSNNGDVDQSNEADTKAYAVNVNDTDQSIDQDQNAWAAGSPKGRDHKVYDHKGNGRCGCDHKGRGNKGDSGPSIDQDQTASNDNTTDQTADATATTEQKNVNLPISFLSWGGSGCGCSKGGGDVDQANSAKTVAFAGNVNDTDQSIDQDQNAWTAGSPKGRDHKGYDHKGNGRCGCDHKGHGDKGGSGPSIDQDQSASNDNTTGQTADASATTEQKNFNAPLSFFSWGSNAGDVDQSNEAVTKAYAVNANETEQSVDQGQRATADKRSHRPHGGKHDGHGKGPKHPDPCRCEPPHPTHPSNGPHDCGCTRDDITQQQTGDNTNETTQRAYADAATKQKNVNTPFSFFSWDGGKRDCGCSKHGQGHGDDGVRQDNDATTKAFAANGNQTRQSIDQWQEALIGRR